MVTGVTEEIRHYRDMVTGVTEEIRHCRDMVTGVQGEIRYCPDMVTGGSEEIPYCSSGNSSGKRKKALSISQPQFCSENTPATFEADQIFWPFSNWRRTVFLPMSIKLVTESRNCLNPSRQQCPPLTGNHRNLNCLKIYSKRV